MAKFKFTWAQSVVIHASDEKAALAKWRKLNTENLAEEMKSKPEVKENQWEYLIDFENEVGQSLCDPVY
jgi:hypothetical protein